MTDPGIEGGIIEEVDGSRDGAVADWERLADRVGANPFLYPGFVLAWQRAFGRAPLLLATVRRQGQLAAALPLIRRGAVLACPANWHTPQTGVLAEDVDAATALARLIGSSRPRRISLAFVDGADESTLALSAEVSRAGYRVLERTLTRSPYLELLGGWAEFEASMKSSTRRNLRRLRRRLEERGTVTLDEVDGGVRLEEGLAEVTWVEGLAWKSGRGTAIASQQNTREFYGDVARWAAGRGWLRIHVLRLDGDPIAVCLVIEAHGVFYGIKLGYDPAYSRLSPGMVMLNELVRRAFENGLSRVEMLGTDDAYKRTWCPDVHERISLQAFAPTIAGRVDHLALACGRPLVKRLASKRLQRRLANSGGPRL
jgi:CelD/BcsL family acetyltransferase involved in cellulose biosynthesis